MAHAPLPDARTLKFCVDAEQLGMDASLVREVVPLPPLARVPHAPAALMGVAQIRGAIVPVLSVASLLGRDRSASERVIVTEMDGPIGLAVTAVSGMAEGDEAAALMRIDVATLVAGAVPERRARRAASVIVATSAETADTVETITLIAFAVAGQEFAFPLAAIDEVLRLPPDIARMPHADAATLGSIAVPGAVLPLLSLAALLALPVAPMTSRSRIVVVRIGTHRVGLVVDEMRSIERVPESSVDAVPQVLNRGKGESRIQAICRLDGGSRLLSVLAPDQLVNETITAQLQQREMRDKDEMTSGTYERGERFLLFRIGDQSFGLPIDAVQEVALLPPRLTPLPKAPPFVEGVMNVRGQIIPVINQAHRFNGSSVASAKSRVIVARVGELTAGFIVEAVSQVVEPPASAIRETPELGSEGARVFDRVASLDGEDSLVLIISPQELLNRAEQDFLIALDKKAAKQTP